MGGFDSGDVQSMTGFARGDGGGHGSRWIWELRSVNGKGLDIRFRGPAGMEQLEPRLREMAATRFTRGNIQLALSVQNDQKSVRVEINRPVLDLRSCRSQMRSGQRLERPLR